MTAQAESAFRAKPEDIPELKTRSDTGAVVPLGSLVQVENRTGPDRVVRYNLYPAADVNGSTRPGFSSGQSLDTMEQIARQVLPAGIAFEWTDLAYQERLAGNVALYIFPICVFFVFLTLSAQYRELDSASRGDSDRTNVLAMCNCRCMASRHGKQYSHSDRIYCAGRLGLQERYPHCAVRQIGRR